MTFLHAGWLADSTDPEKHEVLLAVYSYVTITEHGTTDPALLISRHTIKLQSIPFVFGLNGYKGGVNIKICQVIMSVYHFQSWEIIGLDSVERHQGCNNTETDRGKRIYIVQFWNRYFYV